jgi:hypothetical protein
MSSAGGTFSLVVLREGWYFVESLTSWARIGEMSWTVRLLQAISWTMRRFAIA